MPSRKQQPDRAWEAAARGDVQRRRAVGRGRVERRARLGELRRVAPIEPSLIIGGRSYLVSRPEQVWTCHKTLSRRDACVVVSRSVATAVLGEGSGEDWVAVFEVFSAQS